jgi:hypothetical protein
MLNFSKKLFARTPADSTESAPYKIETPAAEPIEAVIAPVSVDQSEPDVWPFPGSAPSVPATPVAEAKPAARKPRAAKAKAAPAETTKTADKKPAQPRRPRKPQATS